MAIKATVRGWERVKRADRDSFYKCSYAIFNGCEKPAREPDYISESGSAYWYSEDGVIREADHWGNVATCIWEIRNIVDYDLDRITGFCAWEAFDGAVKLVEKEFDFQNRRSMNIRSCGLYLPKLVKVEEV